MMKRRTTLKVLAFLFSVVFAVQFLITDGSAAGSVDNGLVAHYKFDSDFNDSSGNALNGQSKGDVPFGDGVPGLGKSARFGSGYLLVKDANVLDFDKAFTISMWLRTATDIDKSLQSKTMVLFTKPTNKSRISYQAYLFGGKTPYLKLYSSQYRTTGSSDTSKQLTLLTEKWCLLTITYNATDVVFFIDGKSVASVPLKKEDNTLFVGDGDLYIGSNSNGDENQYGFMDDLRLYNRTLSNEEVTSLYTDVMGNASGIISLQIDNPIMTVNNVKKEIDPGRGTKPVVYNNRTVVPISAIIKEIGGTVSWNVEEKRVDIAYKGKTVKMWIDKYDAEVNGEKKTMDTAPVIMNERTMLPLRFVAESLGFQVEWEALKKKIIVRYTP